jgi:hypothetical protein
MYSKEASTTERMPRMRLLQPELSRAKGAEVSLASHQMGYRLDVEGLRKQIKQMQLLENVASL